jgi:hypothetical protein
MWNGLIGNVLEKCEPNKDNIMIPGSSKYSDLSTPITVIKNRVKDHLFSETRVSETRVEINNHSQHRIHNGYLII